MKFQVSGRRAYGDANADDSGLNNRKVNRQKMPYSEVNFFQKLLLFPSVVYIQKKKI